MLKLNKTNLELQVEQILYAALSHVQHSGVVVAPAAADDNGPVDLAIRVLIARKEYEIVASVKANGQPKPALDAINALSYWSSNEAGNRSLLFCAPYLSPEVRQLCHDRSICYLDLHGNLLLKFGHVYIEKESAAKPKSLVRELKSLFRPKSAQVLRLLLRRLPHQWTLKALSEQSGVSLGHVSNVRNALRERDLLTETSEGFRLAKPSKLLDQWRDAYEGPSGKTYEFYTALHGTTLDRAARKVLSTGTSAHHIAIYASFSAARIVAPYIRGVATTYFYADELGLARLTSALSLMQVKSGANVLITVFPPDDGVFFEPEGDFVHAATNSIQTYLDLASSGERGREAAEHLREENLKWLA